MNSTKTREDQFHRAYMNTAYEFARLSRARRLQVGCILVKENRIISIGFNGTPAGWNNNCEHELEDGSLISKSHVIHAEKNAIAKLAKSSESSLGATVYCTHLPCVDCATLLIASGIGSLHYAELYRDNSSLQMFRLSAIPTYQLSY